MLPQRIVPIFLLALLALVPARAHASINGDLAGLIARSPYGASTSVAVARASDGAMIYSHRANRSVTPASNAKLLTSAGALVTLGPDARLRTRLALTGMRQGTTTWNGDLYLIGGGDPTLSTTAFGVRNYRGKAAFIDSLVDGFEGLGIRRVRGQLIVDESRFDRMRWVGSWPARFRFDEATALGALSVNQSYLGAELDGPSSHDPALRAAYVLRTQLAGRGIHIDEPTSIGSAPLTARTVATVESPAIGAILRFMNRTSDNFTAEILLKDIAAESSGKGTTSSGARGVLAAFRTIQAPRTGVRVADGSGLSGTNRTSAASILGLLQRMDGLATASRDAFITSLAVNGKAGTLKRRMKSVRGRVLAKTGTLNQSVALSGYATSRSGRRYVFSIVTYVPGARIDARQARRLHDAIGVRLAS